MGAACGGGSSQTPELVEAPAATMSAPTAATSEAVPDPAATPTFVEPGPLACNGQLGTGYSRVDCEGISFDVSVPDVCFDGSCGLVVDVHGFTASSDFAERHTGMQALGNDAGYVVVQPDNPKPSWDPEIDDDRVRSFLDQLIEALALDRDRVHIGGFSEGGWMTWRFICNHSDLIASAAPIGAGATSTELGTSGVSCDFDATGFPAQEVDILYMHGRGDTGETAFDGAVEQRDLVVSSWEMTETATIADQPDHRWTRWTSPNGSVFEFVEHDWKGGGLGAHCYPGATAVIGCGADTAVNYAEAALQFYTDHPKDQ
jgi:polyhydroxybutyrate depolymerase